MRSGATHKQREAVLDRWYRDQFKALVAPMFAKWQAKLGAEASAWGVKRMKTKWGSCTLASRRVWLSFELAKKPVECIEYIVVHELLHLAESAPTRQRTGVEMGLRAAWPARGRSTRVLVVNATAKMQVRRCFMTQ